MQKKLILALLLVSIVTALAQNPFPRHQLSINGFRNPSIGLEYQHNHLSVHGGYYHTNFESGITTEFLKTGLNYWFFPHGKKEIPSSCYAGLSYLRGLTGAYKDKNAFALEAGYRWYAWKGLNFRLGAIALASEGKSLKVNPTPGVSYSFKF